MAGDNTNTSFCTVVQTGGRDVQEELKIAAKSISNTALAKSLGVKTKAKKRKTNDEKRDEYIEPYEKALDKMSVKGNNPSDAKLTKTECAAVVTLGFGKYTSTSGRLADLQRALNGEISKGKERPDAEKIKFWTDVDARIAKRRRVGEPSTEPPHSDELSSAGCPGRSSIYVLPPPQPNNGSLTSTK